MAKSFKPKPKLKSLGIQVIVLMEEDVYIIHVKFKTRTGPQDRREK
jgi:hypothetical protein